MRNANRTLGLVFVGLVAMPGAASASPSYPGDIQTILSLNYSLGTNHCTICHASNAGGVGTVVTTFGKAMKAAGLVLEDESSLKTALSTLESDMHDSDCNGLDDIAQLQAGRDPNAPGEFINGSTATPPSDPGCGADAGTPMTTIDSPTYGCNPSTSSAQVSSGPISASGAAGLATVLALSALATRRGRRVRSS